MILSLKDSVAVRIFNFMIWKIRKKMSSVPLLWIVRCKIWIIIGQSNSIKTYVKVKWKVLILPENKMKYEHTFIINYICSIDPESRRFDFYLFKSVLTCNRRDNWFFPTTLELFLINKWTYITYYETANYETVIIKGDFVSYLVI